MTIKETIPIVDNVHPMYVMILSAFCIGFDWSTKEYVLMITGQYICSEYVCIYIIAFSSNILDIVLVP